MILSSTISTLSVRSGGSDDLFLARGVEDGLSEGSEDGSPVGTGSTSPSWTIVAAEGGDVAAGGAA